MQELSAAQDREAAEVERGVQEAQAELQKIREQAHTTATRMATQSTTILKSTNPFADLASPAASFQPSFDFNNK